MYMKQVSSTGFVGYGRFNGEKDAFFTGFGLTLHISGEKDAAEHWETPFQCMARLSRIKTTGGIDIVSSQSLMTHKF